MTRSLFTQRFERLRRALVEARMERGLTQAQVAQALRKPQSFVSKYERGERRLDVVEFLDVARALAVSPYDLLHQVEQGDRP